MIYLGKTTKSRLGAILEYVVRLAVLITDTYNALNNQFHKCQMDKIFLVLLYYLINFIPF